MGKKQDSGDVLQTYKTSGLTINKTVSYGPGYQPAQTEKSFLFSLFCIKSQNVLRVQIRPDGRCVDHNKPIQQPAELLRGDPGKFLCIPGPFEASDFETFVEKKKTIAFPDETFESVFPGSAEQKEHIFLEWIKLELFFDEGRKTVDALAQIRPPAGDVDL
jgi:hypothetical protein